MKFFTYLSIASCNGQVNRHLSIPTVEEQLQINQFIYKVNFVSALNFFPNLIRSGVKAVAGFLSDVVSGETESKSVFTFERYNLNGVLKGDDADLRIQSGSKTYSHVVMKVGRMYEVTQTHEAFRKSCECGETVYLT